MLDRMRDRLIQRARDPVNQFSFLVTIVLFALAIWLLSPTHADWWLCWIWPALERSEVAIAADWTPHQFLYAIIALVSIASLLSLAASDLLLKTRQILGAPTRALFILLATGLLFIAILPLYTTLAMAHQSAQLPAAPTPRRFVQAQIVLSRAYAEIRISSSTETRAQAISRLAQSEEQILTALGRAHLRLPHPSTSSRIDAYLSAHDREGDSNTLMPTYIQTDSHLSDEAFLFVLAHEWFHVGGIIDETTANYLAFRACLRSHDPLLTRAALHEWLEESSIERGGLSDVYSQAAWYDLNAPEIQPLLPHAPVGSHVVDRAHRRHDHDDLSHPHLSYR